LKAVCIVNPASRRAGRWDEAAAVRALRATGYQAVVWNTTGPNQATELARRAVEDGADLVIACGGDGTFNEVLNGLAGSDVALGFVPLGTTNIWRRETGLPKDCVAAVRAAATGQRARIDLGVANGRYFALMCGAGYDAYVTARVGYTLKRRLGFLAYIFEAVRAVGRYQPPRAAIVIDGRMAEAHLLQMVLSNTRNYGGFLHFARRARADDGLLEVRLLTGKGALAKAAAVTRFLYNALPWAPAGERAASVRIEAPGIPLQLDGEYVGVTPAQISVARGALTVVVPRGPLPTIFSAAAPAADKQR
jgi:YegS/Rv2252/BmrU family lipid kinase